MSSYISRGYKYMIDTDIIHSQAWKNFGEALKIANKLLDNNSLTDEYKARTEAKELVNKIKRSHLRLVESDT